MLSVQQHREMSKISGLMTQLPQFPVLSTVSEKAQLTRAVTLKIKGLGQL